jgi:tRNA(Arg) A34 adenosine deaminase TadA
MTDATLDPIPGLLARVRVVPRRDFLAAATALTAAAPLAAGVAQAQPAPGAAPTEQDRAYMRQAIELMRRAGVVEKTGGPFGAVVVREGRVLASSGNSVLRDNDPSAHAEVNAIRLACRAVNSPNLRGATLYSSCEPCPMCYATAYWARVERIFYAAAWTDYADLFDDSNISQDVAKPYPERRVPLQQILQEFRQTPGGARY